MSIESFKKLETYKGMKKLESNLEKLFVELKYNNKRAKYNYHAGLVAGMLVRDLTIIEPIIKEGEPLDKELGMKIFEQLIPKARSLVEDFNWKLEDLKNLISQFFGDASPQQDKESTT